MAGALTAMIAAAFSGVTPDPYFEYTTLLLPGSGTNGAQNNTFLDGSTNNFTITRNGNTTQGTFSPFSQTGWGNYFNGSSRLSLASNVALTPGSGDFTIECWIYPTAAFSTYNGIFVGEATGAMNFGKISGGIGLRISGTSDIISATAPSINQWTHIAITRSGTDVRLFYNGVQQGSTVTNSTNFVQSATAIGDNGGGTAYWNGYISNLRFVKGTALYTSNFTPSTAPLTAISNTQLLTLQSNRFIDNSTNAFTLTPSGSPSVVAFSPFNPTASWSAATNGGSGYFDGSGDWINPNTTSANLALGSGDFTIEFWLYTPRGATRQYICDFRNNGSTGTISPLTAPSLIWGDNGADTNGNWFRYLGLSNGSIVANADLLGVTLSTLSNQWNHIAVVRSSGTVYGYLNGVRKNSVADSTNYNVNCSVSVASFANGTVSLYLGYISNFRVVKGTAVYTGTTYTVPTAPLTAITNTQLLLNFTNAGIYDATSKNDLETVGNAQISNAVTPQFGSTSIKFDGTGDYLLSQASNDLYAFGSGDFTIELWLRLNNVSGQKNIYDPNPTSTVGLYPNIYILNTTLYYFTNGSNRITAGTALSADTWYHIAVARSGTSTKLFLNGTQEGSTYTDSNVYINGGAGRPVIGGSGYTLGSNILNGYIQDLRITKGYARYTANFTPPTAAFPTL